MEKMFEEATRLKLRVQSNVGMLLVEDLWDLSLPQLNGLAKSLNKELKEAEEEDFLEEKVDKYSHETKLAFEIIVYILKTKQAENKALKNAKELKAKKDKLVDLLARKEDEKLEGLSAEEIRKQIDELGI